MTLGPPKDFLDRKARTDERLRQLYMREQQVPLAWLPLFEDTGEGYATLDNYDFGPTSDHDPNFAFVASDPLRMERLGFWQFSDPESVGAGIGLVRVTGSFQVLRTPTVPGGPTYSDQWTPPDGDPSDFAHVFTPTRTSTPYGAIFTGDAAPSTTSSGGGVAVRYADEDGVPYAFDERKRSYSGLAGDRLLVAANIEVGYWRTVHTGFVVDA